MEHLNTMDEFMKNMEDTYRNKYPLCYWIDNCLFKRKQTILGFTPHYALSHPWAIIKQIYCHFKWAYQRVINGWDDTVHNHVSHYLSRHIEGVLREFSKDITGYVVSTLPDNATVDEYGQYSKQDLKMADDRWKDALQSMIDGFIAAQVMIEEFLPDEDWEKNKKIFDKGMTLFHKHFFDLWD